MGFPPATGYAAPPCGVASSTFVRAGPVCAEGSLGDGWTVLRSSLNRRKITEAALVLAAMQIPHRTQWRGHAWLLLIPEQEVVRAEAQLRSYEAENHRPEAPPPYIHTFERGWVGMLAFLAILWLLPNLEARGAFGWDWRQAGLMSAGLVQDGQWWRTFTALTLHADLGHIVGNSVFAAVFGIFVGRHLGAGFGWLLVLLSGALGNFANALMQPPAFTSLGASTANFAALGLTGAFMWRLGRRRRQAWRRNFAPLFAAAALLAYTGVGGERTDVMAHFTGFAAGVGSGLLASTFDVRRLGKSGQAICGGFALWLLAYAWFKAGAAAL